MITQMRWIDRAFTFDFPVGVFPAIMERLRGTPLRVERLLVGLPEPLLTVKPDGKWSLKERVGHICDAESLWETRLTQFLQKADTLAAADMSNQRVTSADYNNTTIEALIERLHTVRSLFIDKLEPLNESEIAATAHHPRLNKPMRLIDMLYFVAEHDDQELALMRALITQNA